MILLQLEIVTEVSVGLYYYSQRTWLRFLMDVIITARASDMFCLKILLQPEKMMEVSAG